MTVTRSPVTLQINLAHSDLEEALHVLPHQLRRWAGQVSEVVCVIDVPLRDTSAETLARHARLQAFVASLAPAYPHLRAVEVDYSEARVREVGAAFYRSGAVPLRDYRDRAIYPYVFALTTPSHDLILHLDADMIFGGGSQTWIGEAVAILQERPDLLACNPLPGPPRADGRLLSQKKPPLTDPRGPGYYRFTTLSSRVFLLDRRHLATRLGGLRRVWAPFKAAVSAMLAGRVPYDGVEGAISKAMRRRGVFRLDFLGSGPGMWSVHPLHRSPAYVRSVPEVIRMVEAEDIPEAQRGEYDLTPAFLAIAARLPLPV